MATAAELIRRLQSFDLEQAAYDALEQTKDVMIELNQQQLSEGKASDGSIIRYLRGSQYPYTRQYAVTKAKRGLQVSVVDLKGSSDATFWNSEQIKVEGQVIEYFSTLSLADYIEADYGVKIWGLTQENKGEYVRTAFFQAFKVKWEAGTGLKLG
jgi:hypothetical protein